MEEEEEEPNVAFAPERTQTDKSQKMIDKAHEIQDLFNLPKSEFVVQDYHSGLWRGLPYGWWQGRLIISCNHVLFRSTVGPFTLDLKLRELQRCTRARTLVALDNGLELVTLTGKKYHVGIPTPGHRDEALCIINHLLNHPVTLYQQHHLDQELIDQELAGRRPAVRSAPAALETRLPTVSEVPVLHKLSNDSLRFSHLRFGPDTLLLVDGGDHAENVMPRAANEVFEFRYDTIEAIVVRARPLHLDVRFPASSRPERLRMCTAEIQSVVIELHLRAPNARVEFEAGPMPRFLYDKPRAEIMGRFLKERRATIKSFRDTARDGWRYSLKVEGAE